MSRKIYLIIKLIEKDLVSVPVLFSFLPALRPLPLRPGLMCQHRVVWLSAPLNQLGFSLHLLWLKDRQLERHNELNVLSNKLTVPNVLTVIISIIHGQLVTVCSESLNVHNKVLKYILPQSCFGAREQRKKSQLWSPAEWRGEGAVMLMNMVVRALTARSATRRTRASAPSLVHIIWLQNQVDLWIALSFGTSPLTFCFSCLYYVWTWRRFRHSVCAHIGLLVGWIKSGDWFGCTCAINCLSCSFLFFVIFISFTLSVWCCPSVHVLSERSFLALPL